MQSERAKRHKKDMRFLQRNLTGFMSRPAVRTVARSRLIELFIAVVLGASLQELYQTGFRSSEKLSSEATIFMAGLAIQAIVIVLGLVVMTIVIEYIEVVKRSHNFDVQVWTDQKMGDTTKSAFTYCGEVAFKSEERIAVLAPFFPTNVPADTKNHDDFLTVGLKAALDRHSRDPESDFSYIRVTQLSTGTADGIGEDGVLASSTLNNPGMASHIAEMLKANGESLTVDVRVYARDAIPSFPSTLVVDDQHVFFSLPTMTETPATETGPARSKLHHNAVLGIRDRTGSIPTFFRQIITQFQHDSREIKKIRDDQKNQERDPINT